MKQIIYSLLAAVAILAAGCTNDLDQQPVIGETSGTVYSTVAGYKSVLAKIYGSYSLVGQYKGGNNDIDVEHDLLRNLFYLQEAGTDEVTISWAHSDLTQLTYHSWDATNPYISNVYYRLFYSIAVCNEFLRNCSDDAIAGFTADEQSTLRTYAAEARFIRALGYWLALDLFRQAPIVDENTPTGSYIPEAYDAKGLIAFLLKEIDEIEPLLLEPAPYGRAGKAALWALGARLTLNAETYGGEAMYSECIDFCNKIAGTGNYTLEADYSKLFNADNDKRTNEILFAFVTDGDNALSWGSATHIVCGSCTNDNADAPAAYGIANGWGSWRVRGEFYDLFDAASTDARRTFWTTGQTQFIPDGIAERSQGYYSMKWTNLTDAGQPANANTAADGCNTDHPIFRLGEIYLTAAEAVLRGGQGLSRSEALALVNELRCRAYGDDSGKIADTQFDLAFMIDERGRELYHELHRRTDLVRFGRFTGDRYIWQWKGGVVDGRATDARYNIYPVPATEISANPNLVNKDY